jgi:hypothetical protein
VKEEKEWQLYLDKLGLGGFCSLGFGLFVGCGFVRHYLALLQLKMVGKKGLLMACLVAGFYCGLASMYSY